MKQSAVEWMTEQLVDSLELYTSQWEKVDKIINQAKEMEKQQLENCAIYFTNYTIDTIEGKKEIGGEKQFEQYYNETYETK